MTVVKRSRGVRRRVPVVDRDRLPGLVPGEIADRNRRRGRADVRTEREQAIEPPEELHVPGLRFGDGELRERRIGVDEDLARDRRVLVAPEPRTAGEVDEEIRTPRVASDLVSRAPVIAAVVVDEAPAVTEPVRRERAVDVVGAVARIDRARVLNGVVDAFAGIFDVEDLVAERAQTEQVHQRAPSHAAEGISRNDAGEEDPS